MNFVGKSVLQVMGRNSQHCVVMGATGKEAPGVWPHLLGFHQEQIKDELIFSKGLITV